MERRAWARRSSNGKEIHQETLYHLLSGSYNSPPSWGWGKFEYLFIVILFGYSIEFTFIHRFSVLISTKS